MAIDIVSQEIIVDRKQEKIVLMDDYGTAGHIYVSTNAAETRQQRIDDYVKVMQANQDAMESYANTHGHDLSAQKAAGIAKKTALLVTPAKPIAKP